MMATDAGDYFLLISCIFFPQEKLRPGLSRPLLFVPQAPGVTEAVNGDFKYRLFYGGPGNRLVGYDNERGKGDHRHFHGVEESYGFQGWEKLIDDFLADVTALRGDNERS